MKTIKSTALLVIALACSPSGGSARERCDLQQEVNNPRLELVAYRRVAQSPASKVRRSETYAFYPIAGIAFNHGQVWARTFGADYFPVRLVEADGALHLDGLTYRISVPGAAKDEFAEAVDIYRRPGTQAVVRRYDCESNELELHVFSKQRGIDESIFFRPAGG